MVDLTFKSRAEHFVPLALLKYIADLRTTSSTDGEDSGIPAEIAYLGVDGVQALKGKLGLRIAHFGHQPSPCCLYRHSFVVYQTRLTNSPQRWIL